MAAGADASARPPAAPSGGGPRTAWQPQQLRDEKTCREDFTTAEVHEIAARLLKQEKEAAKARQAAAGPKAGKGAKKPTASDESAEPIATKGKAIEKVAKAVGVGASKLRQFEAVYEAADEDPKLAPVKESLEREERAAPSLTQRARARSGPTRPGRAPASIRSARRAVATGSCGPSWCRRASAPSRRVSRPTA